MVPAKLRKHSTSFNKTLKENEGAENDLDETKTSDLLSMNVEQPEAGIQFEDEVKISLDEAKNEKNEETNSSNKTLKENEGAENDLDETKTSDLLPMNVEQPKAGIQFEDEVKISLDEAKNEENEENEETNSGERKTADNDYENTIMTEINGDNLAEEDQNTSEDDEIDYEEDSMRGEDEENSEEYNEKNPVDKDEVSVEVETEEDDDESGEDDEESEEEDDEEWEEEDDEEWDEEDDEESEEEDDDKQNKEEEKELADEDGGKSEEPTMEKVEASLKEEVDKSRGRSRKKGQARSSKKLESGDEEKPESPRKRKAKKRVKTMGMIFMCSSTTKNDCYRYRVLGLPASRKNMVEKIYTGMRLFLYDVDLKLLNGIYKAAGPGGYNIEPRAFKSQFPSQVRFTVLEDCLPIAEEKFKKVIKDNYFTKTKFDCLLTSEQVKKLCKLFVATSKGRRQIKLNRSRKAENHKTECRDRPRKQREMRHTGREALSYRKHLRKRQRKIIAPGSPVRQPLPLPVPAPLPSTVPSYAYERTLELDVHRQYPYIESRNPYRDDRDPPTERRRYYRDERCPPTECPDSYRDEREHRDSYRDGREHRDSHRDGREHRDSHRDGREPPAEHRDYYEDGRDPPAVRRDSYRDRRDPQAVRHDSYRYGQDPPAYRDGRDPPAYRDGRDPPIVRRDSYRDGRDPPIVRHDSYRDGRDPPIERRSSYRDGQDPYLEQQSPYRDGRASYAERPYRDGRDPCVGRQSPYRDQRDTYIERHDPYNDVRDSYLQLSGPYRDGLQFEPSDTYRRDPIIYREDRLAETPDSYRQKVLLDHHNLQPAHLETRWLHDIGSQNSQRVRTSYAEPTYPAEYPSRVGLERDYRPVSLLTAHHSTTVRLPEYHPRRA